MKRKITVALFSVLFAVSLTGCLSDGSSKPEEKELLLAPGTKFKVLDMQLDGEANILYGKEGSWKIYLSTISESEEGIQKKVA